jgi:hypothetical protein
MKDGYGSECFVRQYDECPLYRIIVRRQFQRQLTRTLRDKSAFQLYVVLAVSPKISKAAYWNENYGKLLHAKIVLSVLDCIFMNKESQDIKYRCTNIAQENALHST